MRVNGPERKNGIFRMGCKRIDISMRSKIKTPMEANTPLWEERLMWRAFTSVGRDASRDKRRRA